MSILDIFGRLPVNIAKRCSGVSESGRPVGELIMHVTYDKATKKLTIIMDVDEKGTPSSTGKSMKHASSGGNQATAVQIGGKPLIVGINAYCKV